MEKQAKEGKLERIAVNAGLLIMGAMMVATPPLAIYDIFIRDKKPATEEIEHVETTTTTLPETGVTTP